MEDSLFNDLVKSLEEVKEFVEGNKKLKTTKVNAAEQANFRQEEIEDEIDIKIIEGYEESLKMAKLKHVVLMK